MSSTTPMVVFFLSIKGSGRGQRLAFSERGFVDFNAGKLTRRNRVITAGVPRSAFHEAHDSQADSTEQAVFLQGDLGVVRASRGKAAAAVRVDDGQGRRKRALIDPD